mgnify:CR=1 FL=1
MSRDVALLEVLRARLDALSQQHLIRQRRAVESACGPQLMIDGRPLSAFCSNDYLGLAGDARIAEALAEGASRYGTGSGASHLISGHSTAHALLEETLAGLTDGHLKQTVLIRSEPMEVHEALHRSMAHAAYHVGQIVYLGKMFRGGQWKYLSIAPGGSDAFNAKLKAQQPR